MRKLVENEAYEGRAGGKPVSPNEETLFTLL